MSDNCAGREGGGGSIVAGFLRWDIGLDCNHLVIGTRGIYAGLHGLSWVYRLFDITWRSLSYHNNVLFLPSGRILMGWKGVEDS